jgi:hypothetical protein
MEVIRTPLAASAVGCRKGHLMKRMNDEKELAMAKAAAGEKEDGQAKGRRGRQAQMQHARSSS